MIVTCVINIQHKHQIVCLTTPGRIGPTCHFKHFIFVQKKKIKFYYRISVSYVSINDVYIFDKTL